MAGANLLAGFDWGVRQSTRTYTGNTPSDELALAEEVFDKFCSAVTFKSIITSHRQLCELLKLRPTHFPNFYTKLKAKLKSWKAQALWSKFDKRASHRCYNRGRACPNTRVLIIGGGPCGLRTAIEAQLLGAKVVVVEKRDRFSRNNVLHLWPFVINDLRALGAKKFFGKFCAGSIDHISIRQLQCILLKVALLLGVEVHENVAFEELIEPPEDQSVRIGWRAKFTPADHPVSQYEFDVLIGADGKRNTLQGFKRKEFRGRLAIAITANFVNRRSEAEARVEEISGVAFIFNQKFFRELYEATGIDLENIVYYKDETHYFVMTAKKHSLINKGVIIKDYPDTATLLSADNVNREALMDYAREAADFSTNYQLPHLDFAVNHYGKPDVAMFDFTSMFAAENASRMIERRGHKLLLQLVGDSLLEPFWPTGSGCARGFLGAFDACWAIRSMASGRMSPLEVLGERESIYRLLAQTTPENLNKDHSAYTLEPQTRYPNLNTKAVLPFQVRSLFDTDNPEGLEQPVLLQTQEENLRKRLKRNECLIHQDALLAWLKEQVVLHSEIQITDTTTSFKTGLALCAIIHRYRPDLLDFASLDPDDWAANNQLAFDILEELGIPPVATGMEMAQCYAPDKLAMMSYLCQVYDLFRSEIPHVKHTKMDLEEIEEEIPAPPVRVSSKRHTSSAKAATKLSIGTKRRSVDKAESREGLPGRASVDRKGDSLLRKPKKRRSNDRTTLLDRENKPLTKAEGSDDLRTRARDLEAKFRGAQATEKKPKDLIRAIGKIDKTDWNLQLLEKKREENMLAASSTAGNKVPKWNRDAFSDKFDAINKRLHGEPVEAKNEKVIELEENVKRLERKLKEGNTLEVGQRGSNKVSAMAEQLTSKIGKEEPNPSQTALAKSNSKPVLNLPSQGGSETCHFCKKRVYLMERMTAEGKFFHRGCFRCEYCSTGLRLGGYGYVRDDVLGGLFFCTTHVSMAYYLRTALLRRRDESDSVSGLQVKEPQPPLATPVVSKIMDSSSPSKQTPLREQRSPRNLDDDFLRDGTPERVEFENSIEAEAVVDEASEIDEDEWTDHNFGSSVMDSSEEMSSSDGSSSDDDEDGDEESEPENMPDEIRTTGEPLAEAVMEEVDDVNEVRLDIPPEALLLMEKRKKGLKQPPTSGQDEVSDDDCSTEEYGEEEDDYEEEEEEEEYEEGEGESEYEEEEEEEEEENSATEIETDSEFDHNSNVDVRSGPQEIPTIVIDESEHLRSSNEQLMNGNETRPPVTAEPNPEYVAQRVTLENACPAPGKGLEDRSSSLSNLPGAAASANAPRSGILAYLRRHELMDSSPSVDMLASKNALELKKKYLQDCGSADSIVRNSASSTGLDTRFRKFVDQISEAQKLLNPAPQPSPSMQVFLKSTEKIFHGPTPSARFGLAAAAAAATPETKETGSSPLNLLRKNTKEEPEPPAEILAASSDADKSETSDESDSSDAEGESDCVAESMDGDTATDLGTDSGTESTSLLESVNEQIVAVHPPHQEVEARSDVFNSIMEEEEVENSEEQLQDPVLVDEELKDIEKDPESCKVVESDKVLEVETRKIKEEQSQLEAKLCELSSSFASKDIEVIPNDPAPSVAHLATQEDFDVSLVSEKSEEIVGSPVESSKPSQLTRFKSKDSMDSSKLALTEPELSDWGEGSLHTDFELDVKESGPADPQEKVAIVQQSPLDTKPGICNLDDIEFADNSETSIAPSPPPVGNVKNLPSRNIQTKVLELKEELNEPPPVPTSSLPSSPEDTFHKVRDSLDVLRTSKMPLYKPIAPRKETSTGPSSAVGYEPSPNVRRKREALSMERDRQSDLIREMVLSRIQRSPDKAHRRGSYSSATPPNSGSVSRSGSESRTLDSPAPKEEENRVLTPTEPLKEAAAPKHVVTVANEPRPQSVAIDCTSATAALLEPIRLNDSVRLQPPPKPPRMLAAAEPLKPQPVQEVKVQAQFKEDNEPSTSRSARALTQQKQTHKDFPNEQTSEDLLNLRTPRIRSFSEPDPPKPPIAPPSPKSDLIHGLFLSQAASPASTSYLASPAQNWPTPEPTKASSFPGISVSPPDPSVVSTAPCTPTRGTQPKKSKDRERRRSLIQTITGLFSKSSEKEKDKEAQKTSPAKSPAVKDKFPLLKLTSKSKNKDEHLKVDADLSPRERASSSPVSPVESKEANRARTSSLQCSPQSEAVPSSNDLEASRSASLDISPSPGATGTRRNPKSSRQEVRQAELKRLRMAQSIQRQLEEIEVKQKELEEQGVRLEKALRGEEEIAGNDEATLMQEWFQLVNEKNALGRYEQELVIRARELELEDRHARLQHELAKLGSDEFEDDVFIVDGSEEPDAGKPSADKERENQLIGEMLDIAEQLDGLRTALEEDRQRYREEDKDLEAQMLAKGLRLTSLRHRKESQV